MYRDEVEQYPNNYSRSILDRIIRELDTTRALTIFSPSGFGKSALAKYMTFNQGYKSRYYDLKKVQFVYVNLNELAAEPFEEQTLTNNQTETNKHKRFLEIIARSFIESSGKLSYDQIQATIESTISNDYKKSFYTFIDNFIRKQGKFTFVILDGLEVLVKPEFDKLKEFLKNLRDQYKTKLDFIFFIGDLNYLSTISRNVWGSLNDLLIHKIILMPMPETNESVLPMHFSQMPLYFNLITRQSPLFKERIKVVDYLGGGYPPFFKYLFRIKDIDQLKNPSYDREIEFASEKLFHSLTEDHQNLLLALVNKKDFDHTSRAFKELEALKILRVEGDRIKLFSPFFGIFLKSRTGA